MSWQPYTLIDAYKPRPPIVYVVDGLFEIPSLSIVYGAPGTLKSFVLQDMVMCIASGRPWLQPVFNPVIKSIKVKQSTVLWIDQDNGARRTHERFNALAVGHGKLPETTPLFYMSMPNPWLSMTKVSSVVELRDTIRAFKAELVVIDNLGTIIGGTDENSAEMIDILSELRQLAENEKCAIVVIHHQRKSNGIKSRAGEGLRGHSSIEAALDLALLIEREEGLGEIKIMSTKTRGVDVPTFGAKLTYAHKPGTKELELAYFEGITVLDPRTAAGLKQIILDTLAQNSPGLNQKDFSQKVKDVVGNAAGINRIRTMIDDLSREGKLDETVKDKNSKFYTLP